MILSRRLEFFSFRLDGAAELRSDYSVVRLMECEGSLWCSFGARILHHGQLESLCIPDRQNPPPIPHHPTSPNPILTPTPEPSHAKVLSQSKDIKDALGPFHLLEVVHAVWFFSPKTQL